jgi:hypothetical protein
VAHIAGEGIGLYEIFDDMTMQLHPESVTGTFANRMVHWETEQAVIGPHVIDADGNVRTFTDLSRHRLTATARHLDEPERKAYFVTMEGLVFEADLVTLEAKKLFDLNTILEIPEGAQPHYKGAHTAQGRLVVANNTHEEEEFLGTRQAGRLAQWDGKEWTIIERNPFSWRSRENRIRGWARATVILSTPSAGTKAPSSCECSMEGSGVATAFLKEVTPSTIHGTRNGCGFGRRKRNAT